MSHYIVHDYIPLTNPAKISILKVRNKKVISDHKKVYKNAKEESLYYLRINGKTVIHIRTHFDRNVIEPMIVTKKDYSNTKKALKLFSPSAKFPLQINNFSYNGFCGKELEGKAPYSANFAGWTNDPGIMICDCSDGKKRRIPTFAVGIKGLWEIALPVQEYNENGPDLIGVPLRS